MTILDAIRAEREKDVAEAMRGHSLDALIAQAQAMPPARDFGAALAAPGGIKLIAEIKRASPSAGLIRPDFDPVALARGYERAGASALSVLTEPHRFRGSLDHLRAVRAAVSLPVLRKDFLFCRYQLAEARAAGADAVLLIIAMLSRTEFHDLLAAADEFDLAPLVEVHNEAELDTAQAAGARIIGINNRDLKTMTVDIATTLRLRPRVAPGAIVVGESGIRTREDMRRLEAAGVNAALVGEALMRPADPGEAAARLLRDEPGAGSP